MGFTLSPKCASGCAITCSTGRTNCSYTHERPPRPSMINSKTVVRLPHPLLDWQRWSQQLHAMSTPYPWLLRGHHVGLGHFTEEGFHVPSGRKRYQDPATRLPDKGPDMGNLPRCQQRITRVEVEMVSSHLELELAFEDGEPFILIIMEVACRATFGKVGVLQDEGIRWRRGAHASRQWCSSLVRGSRLRDQHRR